MIYISNAFSLNMVHRNHPPRLIPNNIVQIRNLLEQGFKSVVGHADTAAIFSQLLGYNIEHNRESIVLEPDDLLIVGQYKGPRLPEGAKELPQGAEIEWWTVWID